MIHRTIGKTLRGKATPFQLMLACILGGMIGFVPTFSTAAGLLVALVLLLIILNANLGFAAIVVLVGKLISYPLLPVSFAAGRVLLDGPTQPLFKWMINTPVLALFGFEHYATTGAMLIGLVFGVAAGLVVVTIVQSFRRKMQDMQEGSERFNAFMKKRSTRFLAWLLIGGRQSKKSYDELADKRIGLPVRPLGVIAAVLVVAFLFIGQMFFAEPIVTSILQRQLEQANGATVDVDSAELDLGAGTLRVRGLAMADPNALDTDLLRAQEVTANISGADLLTKRITLDEVVVAEAVTGAKRTVPGRLVGPPPAPTPPDEDPTETKPGEKTIEDYMAQAEKWKERLAQLRDWIEQMSGPSDEEVATGEPDEGTIERQIRDLGRAYVKASHLIDEQPTLTVTLLRAEGVKSEQIEGEVFDVRGEHLSTQPHLLPDAPHVSVTSRSGRILADLRLASRQSQTDAAIDFKWNELPVDSVAGDLAVGGTRLISGGTMDLALTGGWSPLGVGYIDLPLNVVLHNSTITVPGGESADVDRLDLPIGLRGPLDNPRIMVSDQLLKDALVQAGASRLSKEIGGRAGEALDEASGKIDEALGEGATDDIKETLDKGLGGLFGGGNKKKDDEK